MAPVVVVATIFAAAGNLGVVALVDNVTGDAGTTLIAAMISGVVTIIVAMIGLYATRSRRRVEEIDEEGEKNLTAQLLECRTEVRRLERICFLSGVDPATGEKLSAEQGGEK